MKLIEAIARIPLGFSISFRVERNDEGELFNTACIFEDPPEGGWTDPNMHRIDRDRPRVLVGVSADVDDLESFERLTIGMIDRRWPLRAGSDADMEPTGGPPMNVRYTRRA